MTDRDAYRLSPDDERLIAEAIERAVRSWTSAGGASALPGLERIARHAIGCSEHDLRDVELAYIHERCAAALCLSPTTTA